MHTPGRAKIVRELMPAMSGFDAERYLMRGAPLARKARAACQPADSLFGAFRGLAVAAWSARELVDLRCTCLTGPEQLRWHR